jgi:hypothetical protein
MVSFTPLELSSSEGSIQFSLDKGLGAPQGPGWALWTSENDKIALASRPLSNQYAI